MSVIKLLTFVAYILHLAIVPLLLAGIIRKGKARLQNRVGPSIFQPFRDFLKFIRKGETISKSCTAGFSIAPAITVGALLAAGLMLNWLGVPAPLHGDIFLLVYVIALGKFAASLAALEPGSPFGAIGATREAALSVQTEPALITALIALALEAKSTDLHIIFSSPHYSPEDIVVFFLVIGALWVVGTAELAHMPIDDPTTHLELTMVHEALILENSGRNLALVEYAAALKCTIVFGLIAQSCFLFLPQLPLLWKYLASIGLLVFQGGIVILSETGLVKLKWRAVPQYLLFSQVAAIFACLLAVMEGHL